jgi:transcriptional regulator with XRE-family HTH domain
MAKNFNKLSERVRADPERARRVDEYKHGIRAALKLAELREERDLTQANLAGVLQVSQRRVSGIERQEDLYLSTLSNYVEALGGHLKLEAVFPDEEVELDLLAVTPTASRRR